jgi:hypothetical protein
VIRKTIDRSVKKHGVAASLLFAFSLIVSTAIDAANWLMLQGVEPKANIGKATFWGFIQPAWMQTDGSVLRAGAWAGQAAQFNQLPPTFSQHAAFNLNRARLGLRGANIPGAEQVHYFLLAEFGNNGITRAGDGRAKLVDASLTFNQIPGARIRVGQFKYPGAEEGLQAIHLNDYINYTAVTDQLLNERFFNSDGTDTSDNAGDRNAPNGSIGAFRDIGVQVFDAFRSGAWEHSYAVMLGNGNGIDRGDNDSSKDLYLYASSELLLGGLPGSRQNGLKLFIWQQQGKRHLLAGTAQVLSAFDRTRQGIGFSFREHSYRLVSELIHANGVIPNGTDGSAVPGALNNAGTRVASFNVLADNKASGWYLDFGYALTPQWEIDLRYDALDRGTAMAVTERDYRTTTLGVQYFFSKTLRLTLNQEFRTANAPYLPATDTANIILDGTDDRTSLQLTAVF